MLKLYHEQQVAALCGVHCLNTLLQQGPVFSELDLAQIGHELNALERALLADTDDGGADAPGWAGSNMDDSGMFTIQVLHKALEVWDLQIIPYLSPDVRVAGYDPTQEEAFICNLQEHWFAIRRVGQPPTFYNFNSLFPSPEQLSPFHLAAFLDSLIEQGFTIYVVRGQLPTPQTSAGGDKDGPGRWLTVEEAQAAQQDAASARTRARGTRAVEDALARAGAAGGTLQLRSYADATRLAESGGVAAGSSGRGGGGGHGSQPEWASVEEGIGDDDDDPELAAALAASMEDMHQSRQQQPPASPTTSQRQQVSQVAPDDVSTGASVAVPDEPAEDTPGALCVAVRLPNGVRLQRRFLPHDTVAQLHAFAKQQSDGGKQLLLTMSFPQRELRDMKATLHEAGVEDRGLLTARWL